VDGVPQTRRKLMTSRPSPPSTERSSESDRIPIFIDLDTVLVLTRPGRRAPEVSLQPGVDEGLARLRQVATTLVVLVDPAPPGPPSTPDDAARVAVLRTALGSSTYDLHIVTCTHGRSACDCRKPGIGLIDQAISQLGISTRHGWHIGGDQESVQAGRSAGLRTIRIGPAGEDHLSAVHRPDHEARDLLDAANWIMLEALALP
jgi:D-glycero-D-manno-heptose 1,7-bisphosphate phosphatase